MTILTRGGSEKISLVVEHTEHRCTLEDPGGGRLHGVQLNDHNEVRGVPGGRQRSRAHAGLVEGAGILLGIRLVVLDWYTIYERADVKHHAVVLLAKTHLVHV